jgi:hypothetical protein
MCWDIVPYVAQAIPTGKGVSFVLSGREYFFLISVEYQTTFAELYDCGKIRNSCNALFRLCENIQWPCGASDDEVEDDVLQSRDPAILTRQG